MNTKYEDVQHIFEGSLYLQNQNDLFFYQYIWSKLELANLLAVETELDEANHQILACTLIAFYSEFIAHKEDTLVESCFYNVDIDEFILEELCTDLTMESEDALEHICNNRPVHPLLNQHFSLNELFVCMALPFSDNITSYETYLDGIDAFGDDPDMLNDLTYVCEYEWLSEYIQ